MATPHPHIAKVDVSKIFDSVSQVNLAETIRDKLGWVWEARLRVDPVENRCIEVQAQGVAHSIPRQTESDRARHIVQLSSHVF